MIRKLAIFLIVAGYASTGVCAVRHAKWWNGVEKTTPPTVTFVAAGNLAVSASVTPITVISPACAVDDILIAFLVNKELTVTISAPDGTWTQIAQGDGNCTTAADDHHYAIFWKKATASGASFSFSKSADNNIHFSGVIAAWRSQHGTVPIDATSVGTSVNVAASTNVTFTAFDPTSTHAHVVFAAFYGNDNTSFLAAMSADTNPDCTLRFDLESNLGNDGSISAISGDSDGSNIAARTWGCSPTASAGSTGIVFAIVPP